MKTLLILAALSSLASIGGAEAAEQSLYMPLNEAMIPMDGSYQNPAPRHASAYAPAPSVEHISVPGDRTKPAQPGAAPAGTSWSCTWSHTTTGEPLQACKFALPGRFYDRSDDFQYFTLDGQRVGGTPQAAVHSGPTFAQAHQPNPRCTDVPHDVDYMLVQPTAANGVELCKRQKDMTGFDKFVAGATLALGAYAISKDYYPGYGYGNYSGGYYSNQSMARPGDPPVQRYRPGY